MRMWLHLKEEFLADGLMFEQVQYVVFDLQIDENPFDHIVSPIRMEGSGQNQHYLTLPEQLGYSNGEDLICLTRKQYFLKQKDFKGTLR